MPDPAKYKQIPVHREIRSRLDVIRRRRARKLGMKDLSWNQFFEILLRDIDIKRAR